MSKYLDPVVVLPKIAENLRSFVKLEDKEVTKYMCKLFEGVLDDSTIRRRLEKNYKMK